MVVSQAGTISWRPKKSRGRSLTNREKQVASLLCNGYTYQEIADRLDISVHTAKFHVKSIIRRLEAKNATHAVAMIVREKLT